MKGSRFTQEQIMGILKEQEVASPRSARPHPSRLKPHPRSRPPHRAAPRPTRPPAPPHLRKCSN
jgi:hypothetical protein